MTLKTLRLIMAHATEAGKRSKLADIRPELGVVQFRIWQAQSIAAITQAAKVEHQSDYQFLLSLNSAFADIRAANCF